MSKAEPRANLRDYVLNAIDAVVRKAQVMSCKYEREKVSPALPVELVRAITDESLASTASFRGRPRHAIRHAAHHRCDFSDQLVQGRTDACAHALDAALLSSFA